MPEPQHIPDASVNRLPVYLRALVDMAEAGTHTVSSQALATASAVNSAKVRKDLSYLGSYGTRGVGYDVDYLIHQISRELGLTRAWSVCLVGVGNLGQALARYGGFSRRGFRIAALFDSDPDKVGQIVAGLEVHHVDEVERLVKEHEIAIGVLAVPGVAAQDVAERLVAAGVSSILNFAPTVLRVPENVSVRRVDLSTELQILSFYEQRRVAEESVRHGTVRRRLDEAEGHADPGDEAGSPDDEVRPPGPPGDQAGSPGHEMGPPGDQAGSPDHESPGHETGPPGHEVGPPGSPDDQAGPPGQEAGAAGRHELPGGTRPPAHSDDEAGPP